MVEQLSVMPGLTNAQMKRAFGPNLELDKQLGLFTSFKTGGPAKYFLKVRSAQETSEAVIKARELNLPFYLIGGGSNLLISDAGIDGLVIKVDVRGLKILDETRIICGAGEDLMNLINFAADNGLTGLEFASGIWGTVGGAIYGNAGAYGGEIKDVTKEITLVDITGKIIKVDREYCKFTYRGSALKQSKEIVIDTLFVLSKGDKNRIREKIDEIITIRASKHPVEGKSAGSFFKNIPDPTQPYGKLPAGKLLDEVGCKNLSVGDAKVYEKHANIIVNGGNATSSDIRKLADIMKQRVLDRFGILLEEEVIQLGQF
ncbi:MAG: UDP-N-acetylmuramate dehydrogenase [Candidatus Zixiibacteriota bacterium]